MASSSGAPWCRFPFPAAGVEICRYGCRCASSACSQAEASVQSKANILVSSRVAANRGSVSQLTQVLLKLASTGTQVDVKQLGGRLDDSAVCAFLLQADVQRFVVLVRKLYKAGLPACVYAGPSTIRILGAQLQDLLREAGDGPSACVHFLAALSDCGFCAKDLVPPLLVIGKCAESGDVNLVFRYTGLLPRNVRIFNHVIAAFAEQGDMEGAKRVLESLPAAGYAADMYTYRTLVDACARCGQAQGATMIYQQMVEAGITPNVFVCNSVLNANVRDVNVARRIYAQMEELRVEPDPPTYHILLEAFCSAGRHDLVPDLYRDVERRVASGWLRVDDLTYSRFIHAFGDGRMWQLAMKVKDDMLAAGFTPNRVTWNCLIGACATCGLGGEALRMLYDMVMAGHETSTDSYNMVLHAFAEGGQQEQAFKLFEEWRRDGFFSSMLKEDFWSAEASPDGAKEVRNLQSSQLAMSCHPNVVTYNTMMKACRKAPADGQALMDAMRSAGIVPDQKSWSTLLDTHGTAGDVDGAARLFSAMEEAGIPHDVVSYTSMIKACVLARDPDRAFSFFNKMKDVGVRPNIVTYNTLLRAQRKCGQLREVQRALALYEEMRNAGFAPKDRILKGLLEEWAEGALADTHNGPRRSSTSDAAGGLHEYTELLLQKVAAHASSVPDGVSLVIDLRGLSKAEARLAVLSVLRTLKERHPAGSNVMTDLEIITGAGIIQEAVLEVLQDELGLAVAFADNLKVQQDAAANKSAGQEDASVPQASSSPNSANLEYNSASSNMRPAAGSAQPVRLHSNQTRSKVVTRRPVNTGRLKVHKDSLNTWLQRGRRCKPERRQGSPTLARKSRSELSEPGL